MKKIKNYVWAVLAATAIVFTGCEKQPQEATGKVNIERKKSVFPWEYVMNMDQSRDCTPVGGGVCFENGWGGSIGFGFLPPSIGDVFNLYEEGGIFVTIEEQASGDMFMHMILVREPHEDGHLAVNDNITLDPAIAEAFNVESITLQSGSYPLDMTTYPHGEVLVPCVVVPLADGGA